MDGARDSHILTDAKDSIITINHWRRYLDTISGAILCCGGAAVFLGLASLIRLWKPAPLVPTIKGVLAYLLVFCFGSVWVLAGLRLLLRPGGVRIDANKKEICVLRRTFWLKITPRIFKFEQLKHLKIQVRTKSGLFAHHNFFCVIAGEVPAEVEFDCFNSLSEAQILAKRISDYSGLRIVN